MISQQYYVSILLRVGEMEIMERIRMRCEKAKEDIDRGRRGNTLPAWQRVKGRPCNKSRGRKGINK